MKKSLLLCICDFSILDLKVNEIKEIWKPDRIFILVERWEEPVTTAYITWNTEYEFKKGNIIKVNKKGTTIYTIDALNWLSVQENGVIDKKWSPDWNEYENQLLLSDREGGLKQIPTIVFDIIKE
jgi:hypothetical protein